MVVSAILFDQVQFVGLQFRQFLRGWGLVEECERRRTTNDDKGVAREIRRVEETTTANERVSFLSTLTHDCISNSAISLLSLSTVEASRLAAISRDQFALMQSVLFLCQIPMRRQAQNSSLSLSLPTMPCRRSALTKGGRSPNGVCLSGERGGGEEGKEFDPTKTFSCFLRERVART